jgi:hypothetical protein
MDSKETTGYGKTVSERVRVGGAIAKGGRENERTSGARAYES